jgi:HEAT repeat protein
MRLLLIIAFLILFFFSGYRYFHKPLAPTEASQLIVTPPPIVLQPAPPILDPVAIQKVITTTKDTSPNVRWNALKYLVQIHAPQADALVEEMLQKDSEVMVRKNIVMMLGEHPGPRTSEFLMRALQDQESQVRITALSMLERTSDFDAAPVISGLLFDSDDHVRLQAMQTINALQVKKNEEEKRKQEEVLRKQREEQEKAAQQQQSIFSFGK